MAKVPELDDPSVLSDADWQARLAPLAYQILRQHGTERPGSSKLNADLGPGTYHCAGCGQALFDAETKFDAGCGWPSFYKTAEPFVVSTKLDLSYRGIPRTEVLCGRCGGHLGHVFPDGPPPTGDRFCMNGVALVFQPHEGEPVSDSDR